MRRTIALLAFLLAALVSVPVAAAPPPQTAPPRHTVAERNYADAPQEAGIASVGTVEDDSGDQLPGLTVQKVACHNSSQTTSNGYELREGACVLAYSNGTNRAKVRGTVYRISTGQPSTGNFGWDQSPPHFRRMQYGCGTPQNPAWCTEAGTWQRGPCLGCHSSVGYSLADCDFPVDTAKRARTEDLVMRLGGTLYSPFHWSSDFYIGCGI